MPPAGQGFPSLLQARKQALTPQTASLSSTVGPVSVPPTRRVSSPSSKRNGSCAGALCMDGNNGKRPKKGLSHGVYRPRCVVGVGGGRANGTLFYNTFRVMCMINDQGQVWAKWTFFTLKSTNSEYEKHVFCMKTGDPIRSNLVPCLLRALRHLPLRSQLKTLASPTPFFADHPFDNDGLVRIKTGMRNKHDATLKKHIP